MYVLFWELPVFYSTMFEILLTSNNGKIFIFRTILATKYRIVVPEKSTQLKTITSIARLTWILRRESRNDRTLNSEKLEKSTVKSILEACIACKLAVLNVLPSQASLRRKRRRVYFARRRASFITPREWEFTFSRCAIKSNSKLNNLASRSDFQPKLSSSLFFSLPQ